MATRTRHEKLRVLDLPDAFEDLSGVIGSDLKVIVRALSQRASERMLLSPGQTQQLQRKLWNQLTQVVNETMKPFDPELR